MNQQKLKIALIIHTVVFGLWFPLSLLFWPFIAFLYGDPSAGGIMLTLITLLWCVYPIVLLTSLIGSWVSYKKHAFHLTKWFLLLPWGHIGLFIFLGLFFFEA